MRALPGIVRATPGQTLEVVITIVLCLLLPVVTDTPGHTLVFGTTVCGDAAISIGLAV